MIEIFLREYLLEKLDEEVVLEVPENLPDKFVLVDKLGSDETDQILTTHVAVQAWAATRLEAMILNESIKTAMKSLPEYDLVSSCRLSSDYPYTDEKTKHPRYQAVFDIVHY